MNPESLLAALVDLAEQAGLRVRAIRPGSGADAEAPATSGVCRLRGVLWVMLATSEPLQDQTDVISRALREHCREFLESRYLSPALRERIDLDGESRCPRG